MLEKQFMQMIYNKAKKAEDLLWHSEVPSPYLIQAIEKRNHPGRALDLGCGAGVFSVFLAKNQYQTTGIDFIPMALEMGRLRAEQNGVSVDFVAADLFDWKTEHPIDIVLDSGCLHTIGNSNLNRYKKKLLEWTKPGSDLILGHFGKRSFFDWRPVGPRRRTRQEIIQLLSPEFELLNFEEQVQTGVPLPVGPSVQLMSLWFRRKG